MWTLNAMSKHQTSYRRKNGLKFLTLHSPFCLFLIKILFSTLESTSPNETIRYASKWFILTQRMQNLEFVNLRVCYLCTTHSSGLKSTIIKKYIAK